MLWLGNTRDIGICGYALSLPLLGLKRQKLAIINDDRSNGHCTAWSGDDILQHGAPSYNG